MTLTSKPSVGEMQRILVTGASGFVGRHLIAHLREAFPQSVLLAGSREGDIVGADTTLPLDLTNASEMSDLIRGAAPNCVVHLAAQASVGDSFADPMQTWRINVDGTLALAEIIRQSLPQTLLLHASSAETYGLSFQAGVALDEQAPMAPASPYAASKAAVDVALGEMALRGLRLVRLRPFNHVGPGQAPNFVVAAFARQIARIEAGLQEPIMRVGALDRWRDFLDVRDVCAAYASVLDRAESLPNGVAINIASGSTRRIGDILSDLLARSKAVISVVPSADLMRPTDIAKVIGNASLARQILNWVPSCHWNDTLDSILADWRCRVTL